MIALFETHLTVSDLSRSIAFHRDVVGLELAHALPNAAPRSSGWAIAGKNCSAFGRSGRRRSE